jgi:heterodisulfide reductase subunit A
MEKYDIIIIGAGPAGLEAAYRLAQFKHSVLLLEKEDKIGGKLVHKNKLFPDFYPAKELLSQMEQHLDNQNITVMTNTAVTDLHQENSQWVVMTERESFQSKSVLLASGYDYFDASRKEEYGYGIYPDVITAVELEAMLANGKIETLSGKTPQTIAFLQCVGSRDEKVGNHYCSINCCICAVKQAIEIKELLPNVEQYCFYMDLRMSGQFYEELYRRSQEQYNVQYIRGRVSEVAPTFDNRLQIKAENTLLSRPLKLTVDMLVLMIGKEAAETTLKFAKKFDIANPYGFILSKNRHLCDNHTQYSGLFVAGTCKRPLTIPKTIKDAAMAAAEISLFLNQN